MLAPIPDLPLFIGTLSDKQAHIHAEEMQHLSKVLRLRPGDEILVTNGLGKMVRAIIEEVNKHTCVALIEERYPADNLPEKAGLSIGISLLKSNDRFEFFLEKATEIGVKNIYPLICTRTERKSYNEGRYKKIILSAAKQSLKSSFPILHPSRHFPEMIHTNFMGSKFIAHCHWERASPFIYNMYIEKEENIVLIGPEGDFTKEELEQSIKEKYQPISLGSSRLRTETAGMVACLLFQAKLDSL